MKRIQNLGRILGKTEQKGIVGGQEEESLKLCGEEYVWKCTCGGGNNTEFYCCGTATGGASNSCVSSNCGNNSTNFSCIRM